MALNLLGLVEIGFEIYAQKGFKNAYNRVFRLWIESICQIINVWASVIFFKNLNV
jgi:hypothetical protein